MPQLIKPGQVKILTKDGECQVAITLELTINVNTDGVVTARTQMKKEDRPEKAEETPWAIPDFAPSPKINFGKKE